MSTRLEIFHQFSVEMQRLSRSSHVWSQNGIARLERVSRQKGRKMNRKTRWWLCFDAAVPRHRYFITGAFVDLESSRGNAFDWKYIILTVNTSSSTSMYLFTPRLNSDPIALGVGALFSHWKSAWVAKPFFFFDPITYQDFFQKISALSRNSVAVSTAPIGLVDEYFIHPKQYHRS
jgi:hypothetical protein